MSIKKTMKPIIRVLFIILLIYTAVYGAVFILRIALAVDSPIVVVDGMSMNPTLYDGDMLVIKGVANKSLIEPARPSENISGDIIIFHSSSNWNKLIVHRVINRFVSNDQLYFQTQGDNRQTNPVPDPIIPATNVVGVVIYKIPIPIIGSIILFTQSFFGRLLLISIIIFIVVDMFYNRENKSFINEKS